MAQTPKRSSERSALDVDRPTVHLRCGSDIREGLQEAQCLGGFLEYADPVCQGPVAELDASAFRQLRADFLAQGYGLDLSEIRARLQREDQELAELSSAQRVVLWFEHDPYDQTILARLFSQWHRAETFSPPSQIELVLVDSHPQHPDFRGLGQLTPEQLAGLWPQRFTVDSAMLALGDEFWRAYASGDALALEALGQRWLASTQGGALSAVGVAKGVGDYAVIAARAFERQLAELPATTNGCSHTELGVLRALAGAGNGGASGAELFRAYLQADPLPSLGDSMFAVVLDRLAGAANPALSVQTHPKGWPGARYQLTSVGEALLADELDWLDQGPATTHVGGLTVKQGLTSHRWDPASRRVQRA